MLSANSRAFTYTSILFHVNAGHLRYLRLSTIDPADSGALRRTNPELDLLTAARWISDWPPPKWLRPVRWVTPPKRWQSGALHHAQVAGVVSRRGHFRRSPYRYAVDSAPRWRGDRDMGHTMKRPRKASHEIEDGEVSAARIRKARKDFRRWWSPRSPADFKLEFKYLGIAPPTFKKLRELVPNHRRWTPILRYLQAIKWNTWARIREVNWERETYGSNRAHQRGALNESSAAILALVAAIRAAIRKAQALKEITLGSEITADEVLAELSALEQRIPRLEALRSSLNKPPRKRGSKALRELPPLDGTYEVDDGIPVLTRKPYLERNFRHETRELLIHAGAPDNTEATALAEALFKPVCTVPPYWRDLPFRPDP